MSGLNASYDDNFAPLKASIAQKTDQKSCLSPILDAFVRGQTVDLATLVVNDNGLIELLPESRTTGFCFELSGIPIRVGMHSDGQSIRVSISGDMGFLPYSIESSEKRRAISAVIAATGDLKYSKFDLIDGKHIIMRGSRRVARPFQLSDMFMALAEMIHELNPFIGLLGDCMDHIQTDIPVPGQCQAMNPTKPLTEVLQKNKRRVETSINNYDNAIYAIAAE